MEIWKYKKVILGAGMKIGLMIVLALSFVPIFEIKAQENMDYTLLAPLPDLPATLDDENILGTYVPAIFKLAIGLSAAAAVVFIVLGGFQYMTSDAIGGKSAGKERIKNAIYGLVLVIAAWLILNEINPNLLNINLNIDAVTTTAPKVTLGGELSAGTGAKTPGYKLTQAEIDKNAAMVADLKRNGIEVNNDGKPCAGGEVSGCTNVVGMISPTYQGLKDLVTACGGKEKCGAITISGGTEGGHASHGPNKAPVDLRTTNEELNKYILDQSNWKAPVQQSSLGPIYTVKITNTQNATFLRESNPPHWHVVFENK